MKFTATDKFNIKDRGTAFRVTLPNDFVDDGNIFGIIADIEFENVIYTGKIIGIETFRPGSLKPNETTGILIKDITEKIKQ